MTNLMNDLLGQAVISAGSLVEADEALQRLIAALLIEVNRKDERRARHVEAFEFAEKEIRKYLGSCVHT